MYPRHVPREGIYGGQGAAGRCIPDARDGTGRCGFNVLHSRKRLSRTRGHSDRLCHGGFRYRRFGRRPGTSGHYPDVSRRGRPRTDKGGGTGAIRKARARHAPCDRARAVSWYQATPGVSFRTSVGGQRSASGWPESRRAAAAGRRGTVGRGERSGNRRAKSRRCRVVEVLKPTIDPQGEVGNGDTSGGDTCYCGRGAESRP